MSKPYQAMEWHDSILLGIERKAEKLVLLLRPAYVHKWKSAGGEWIGEGFAQDLDVILPNGEGSELGSGPGVQISDAVLRVSGHEIVELLSVGRSTEGPVDLTLILETGERLSVSGTGIVIEAVGEMRFIELLPKEFAPNESPA